MTPEATVGRIAFVVPRYGTDVVGGAETLCRMLAENLVRHGTPIDVLTTCATNHFTWVNDLPEGTFTENGVKVRRFAVGPRDAEAFLVRHSAIDCGAHLPYGKQVEWMANSVWAPGILNAGNEYDWLIPMPYLFGTTFWTTVAHPDKTVMIPCLHDEHHAAQAVVLDALASCRGVMLNAPGEGVLLDRLLSTHRGGTTLRNTPVVVGGGFDEEPLPDRTQVDDFCRRHGAEPGYLLYAGRRERAKGLVTLFDDYRVYRAATEYPRRLALMGSGDTLPPSDIAPYVVDLGFVPTEDRALAYAGASVLIQPSRLESFGLVLFESWLAGTPVIVNRQSDVLRGHCERSGGGLWYSDAASFTEAVRLVTETDAVRAHLAGAGRDYTLTEFKWSAVRGRFLDALAMWA